MGNRIGKRRQAVEEKYTRPQGLYLHRDVDHKKLRKLILDLKLAPCYPGSEECILNQEECPICFLYYPSLNRSRCCLKGICTECFLQMRPPHSPRPTQCPYCKTPNYAVEYRGERTREERGLEQIEEQKVIEAQIRVRHQEIQAEHERMKRRQEISSSRRIADLEDVEHEDDMDTSLSVSSHACIEQGFGLVSSQNLSTIPVGTSRSHIRQSRDDHFDMDLEDLMVMEAVWMSIQEQGGHRDLPSSRLEDLHTSTKEASPSYGLACTVAALAESQLAVGVDAFSFDACGGALATEDRMANNHPSESEDWPDGCEGSSRSIQHVDGGECSVDNSSEVAEAGTSYAGSDIAVDTVRVAPLRGVNMAATHLLPESFEEQMMLAMAVSLAEARARASPQGVTWM